MVVSVALTHWLHHATENSQQHGPAASTGDCHAQAILIFRTVTQSSSAPYSRFVKMLRLPSLDVLRSAQQTRKTRYSSLPSVDIDALETAWAEDGSEKGPYVPSPDSPTFTSQYSSSARSSYSSSSRNAADSYRPILQPHRRHQGIRCYKLPHRTVRYLCFALISTVVILILSLIRMSYVSSKRLESGPIDRPVPTPQWNDFPFLKRYYGGIRTLIAKSENTPEYPKVMDDEPSLLANRTKRNDPFSAGFQFNPYPEYTSSEYTATYGPVRDCIVGTNLSGVISGLRAYSGVPSGFPDAVLGSAETLGLKDDLCFERFGRLGPYGYGYSIRSGGTGAGLHGDRQDSEATWAGERGVDFSGIKWGELQDRCGTLNKHRFSGRIKTDSNQAFYAKERGKHNNLPSSSISTPNGELQALEEDDAVYERNDSSANTLDGVRLLPRTAILIRTWWTFHYREEDILILRAIIAETSMFSGGEYTVHILVHVQDDNAQIWADDDVYQDVLQMSLPEEFWGLATLWTERQMGLIYGGLHESYFRSLPVHGVYRSTFMPVQWFAQQHPEYEHFWNWEMDVRYTGHFYHLLDRLGSWAREQPRKGIWERSSRFYVPSVHGSWDDFSQMVRVQGEYGTESASNMWNRLHPADSASPGASTEREKPVWGPMRPPLESLRTEDDPIPPMSYEKDKYQWGVGEDADLITLNPLFDPDGTQWILANDVTGYNTKEGLPPRRSATITASRLSRRLLNTMHQETALLRHTMFSEMWPATCALHHGFKAVYAPHPVYIDREWPVNYLAAIFNGGRNGATGGARTSVFGGRQHNFLGTTWFYNAGFAPSLWKRWLGFRMDNHGGEAAEVAEEGRMCLPPMLLHPVKDVRLVVEGNQGNKDEGRAPASEGRQP